MWGRVESRRGQGPLLVVTAIIAALLLPGVALAGPPTLYLPFAGGATWWANGPHSDNGSSGARNSVDLGPGTGDADARAAADGTAHVHSCPTGPGYYVVVDHGGGWSTRYWHLQSVAAGIDGASVTAGQYLGTSGILCGNPTSFSHVHFGLFYNGQPYPLDGVSIGGYTMHAGSGQYNGSWTRDADGATVHTTTNGDAACCLANNQVLAGSSAGGGASPPPPDSDSDGIPDSADLCKTIPGWSEFSGCPPEIAGSPSAQSGDFNGDGNADYCRTVGDVNLQDSRVSCTLGSPAGFGATIASSVLDWGYRTGAAWVDVNGDGKADYCRRVGTTNGVSSYVACTLSTGTGFGATWTSPVLDWGYDFGRAWVDVNGDGRADYCRVVGDLTQTEVGCLLGGSAGFGSQISGAISDWGYELGRAWVDVNGDGRADYCRRIGTTNGASSYVACTLSTGTGFGATWTSSVLDWGYDAGRAWADVSGDGRADYCRVVGSVNGSDSRVACTLSTASGFGATISSGTLDWGYDLGRAWVDVNGDGRADYCRRTGAAPSQEFVACTLSTGSGFGSTWTAGPLDWGYDAGRGWVDVNGDGRSDFCRVVGGGHVACTLAGSTGFGQTLTSDALDWGYDDGRSWTAPAQSRPTTAYPAVASMSVGTGAAGTTVILNGANLTGTRAVSLCFVDAPFTVISDSQVQTQVPQGACSGRWRVTNGAGTTVFDQVFSVVPVPVVSSFSPVVGVAGGYVSLLGSGLSGVSGVSLCMVDAPFRVVSDGRVDVVVPPGACDGRWRVTTAGGTAVSDGVFRTVVPYVMDVSPQQAGVGESVTLSGSGFSAAAGVSLCLVSAQFTVVSETKMVAVVPAGACNGRWRVTGSGGSGGAGVAGGFAVSRPDVQDSQPAAGRAGDTVTIYGAGFSGVSGVSLCFVSASFTVISETKLTAVVPAGACSGRWRVATAGGTAVSPGAFAFTGPALASVSPAQAAVGETVTLVGSGLAGVTAVSLCMVPASFTVLNETTVTATVPVGACDGRWRVATVAGSASSDAFVISRPDLEGVDPASGQVGDTVSLLGSGFTGVTDVSLCNVAAVFTVVSDTKVTAVIPAGACDGRWRITTGSGTATAPGSSAITVPYPMDVSATSAAVGATVVIYGSGFAATSQVTLCFVAAAFTVVSENKIIATVPAGACTGRWRISNANGTGTLETAFTPS